MRFKIVLTVLMCAIVPLAAGCARQGAATAGEPGTVEQVSTGIPLAPEFRIPDIPVPAGFQFDREHSFVFQNSKMDVGRIQYAGKEDIGNVAQFYIDEMPRYNWTLLNVTEHSTVMLFFDKPEKSCTVFLSPKVRGTEIQVSFSPKAGPAAAQY